MRHGSATRKTLAAQALEDGDPMPGGTFPSRNKITKPMARATLLRSVQEASVTGQQAAGQISGFTGGLVSGNGAGGPGPQGHASLSAGLTPGAAQHREPTAAVPGVSSH
jgi:hypothetical protein